MHGTPVFFKDGDVKRQLDLLVLRGLVNDLPAIDDAPGYEINGIGWEVLVGLASLVSIQFSETRISDICTLLVQEAGVMIDAAGNSTDEPSA